MQTFTASQLLPENDMNRNGHSEVFNSTLPITSKLCVVRMTFLFIQI